MAKVLVTGATGFVGRWLRPALLAAGHQVRATTRRLGASPRGEAGEEWVEADLLAPSTVRRAMEGVEYAYYLVHSMGGRPRDFRPIEHASAQVFSRAAAEANVRRIVYLGGVAPAGSPSEHLASRLEVGELLRAGPVPALELRASMIVGNGSASWQLVRDLALRLPAMVLPEWLRSRSRPVAIQDVVVALVRGLEAPLPGSAWFDLPGPEELTGEEILMRIAALRGRRVVAVRVPFLSPGLSSLWLKLVTRADFWLARELVAGLTHDLLPRDERYWELIGYRPRWTFDEAARHALATERAEAPPPGRIAGLEEQLVEMLGPRLKRGARPGGARRAARPTARG